METVFPETFERGAVFIERLAWASTVTVGQSFDSDGMVSIVTADATIKIPLSELVDKQAERTRLIKEKESVQKQLDGISVRLENRAFVEKAPAEIVDTARENAERLRVKLQMIEQSLKELD